MSLCLYEFDSCKCFIFRCLGDSGAVEKLKIKFDFKLEFNLQQI